VVRSRRPREVDSSQLAGGVEVIYVNCEWDVKRKVGIDSNKMGEKVTHGMHFCGSGMKGNQKANDRRVEKAATGMKTLKR
jgi:hypothetical protein